jgi:hypothetical protein
LERDTHQRNEYRREWDKAFATINGAMKWLKDSHQNYIVKLSKR